MCIKNLIIALLTMMALCMSLMSQNNYISHSKEPTPGCLVKNTNPKCLHYASKGKVVDIKPLPDGMGKVVTYVVLNSGPRYSPGDVLTKTMDQLSPN